MQINHDPKVCGLRRKFLSFLPCRVVMYMWARMRTSKISPILPGGSQSSSQVNFLACHGCNINHRKLTEFWNLKRFIYVTSRDRSCTFILTCTEHFYFIFSVVNLGGSWTAPSREGRKLGKSEKLSQSKCRH